MKLLVICLLLVSCDLSKGELRFGTILEVNSTGVRVQWEDGTIQSRQIAGVAFVGDSVCLYSRGAAIGKCRIIREDRL